MEKQRESAVETILVVDDEEFVRSAIVRSLRRLGYEVLTAADGEAGLAMALEHRPDLILTDIRMPGIDGHTLLRRLVGGHPEEAWTVVVMSGHGTMDDVIEAMREGAVDYLRKPWMPSELVGVVTRALELHERHHAFQGVVASAQAEAGGRRLDPAFEEILERVRQGDFQIPAVPRIVTEVRDLLRDPAVTVERIVALVGSDQHLSTEVLGLSNTVRHAGLARTTDLRSAVTRIGFEELRSLVDVLIAHRFFEVPEQRFRPAVAKIWRFSVARALLMRSLADLAGVDADEAHIAGLLADVGASFLLRLVADLSAAGKRSAADTEATLAFVRQHHALVGEAVVQGMGLGPAVSQICRIHHDESPPAPPSRHWSMAVLAMHLAGRMERCTDLTAARPHPLAAVERCSVEIGIGETATQRLVGRLERQAEEIFETLG
jgi:CheY-like chemotaxis protein